MDLLSQPLVALLERFRAGQRLALARAISLVEGERPGFQDFLHAALAPGPRARRMGLTGPPGAGKSSVLAALAAGYRRDDEQVGVVAVDPTSPFSGGALLGDRIRMNDLATDPGIFIRSMATRGTLGGLATTTREVIDLMDAFGMDRVLIETVGVGQTELEITGAADTVVVVLVPESGDAIQAMKAGLMEIADVFVVNKADRPGADRLLTEIRTALHLREGETMRNVPAHHGVDLKAVGRARRGEEAASGEARRAVRAGPARPSSPARSREKDEGVSAQTRRDTSPETRRDASAETRRDASAETRAVAPTETRAEGSVDMHTGAFPETSSPPPVRWQIPVLKTVAQSGEGVDALAEAVEQHRAYLDESGELEARRRARAERRVRDVVERELKRRTWSRSETLERLEAGLDRVSRGEATPYSVARELVERLWRG